MAAKEHNPMTDSELEIQRYELGFMTPDEEVAFERSLAKNPELRMELLNVATGLTALYENLSASMPAPRKQLRHKLLQTIANVVPDPAQYEVDEFVLQAGTNWVKTIIPGVELQLLYVDDDGRAMMKARLAPGTTYPPHERFATEECLVLSGDFWADNQKLTAGDFIAGRTGNEPLPLHSEGGCELLLKIPIPYQIMPKLGNQS